LIVPFIVGGAILAGFIVPSSDQPRRLAFPTQPVPGEEVSLEQAQMRADFDVPLLSPQRLTAACATENEPELRLLATWASDVEDKSLQIGFNYSHGIWVSISPITVYSSDALNGSELAPVSEAFTQADFPSQLETVSVRDHTGWLKPLSRSFDCDSGQPVVPHEPVSPRPSISPDEVAEGNRGVMYDPTTIGSLEWAERGVIVNIAGPYDSGTLMELADGIDWLTDEAST